MNPAGHIKGVDHEYPFRPVRWQLMPSNLWLGRGPAEWTVTREPGEARRWRVERKGFRAVVEMRGDALVLLAGPTKTPKAPESGPRTRAA